MGGNKGAATSMGRRRRRRRRKRRKRNAKEVKRAIEISQKKATSIAKKENDKKRKMEDEIRAIKKALHLHCNYAAHTNCAVKKVILRADIKIKSSNDAASGKGKKKRKGKTVGANSAGEAAFTKLKANGDADEFKTVLQDLFEDEMKVVATTVV